MNCDFSKLSADELHEMQEQIYEELKERTAVVRKERFDAMIKAIDAFRELCPSAKVCDYDYSVFISYIANGDNWDFGD